MKRGFSFLVCLVVLLIGTSSYAVDCTVSLAAGSDPGSLDNTIDTLNGGTCDSDTIAFSVTSVAIDAGDLPLAIFTDATTINGGDTVTITGDVGANVGILNYTHAGVDNTSVLQDVSITNTNTGGYAVYFVKKETTVKSSTLTAPTKVMGMADGDNLVMSNNYVFTDTFDITKALVIGTPSLTAPDVTNDVTARLASDSLTWILSGTVDANANRVELYQVDQTAKTITYIGGGNVAAGDFALSVDVENYNPEDDYALLAMNTTAASRKTSTFSSIYVPALDDTSFYTNVPACETATWLFAVSVKAWNDDSDADGLTNGEEDANKNCIVDTDETNPDSNDTDADTVADAADNCPADANTDQADADTDDIGDVCDADKDGDGIANTSDNCPTTSNADQADEDADGVGDACAEPSTAATSGGGCSLINSTASATTVTLIIAFFVGLSILGRARKFY